MGQNLISFNLKELRLRMGWSRFELSRRLACSINDLVNWEARNVCPANLYNEKLAPWDDIANQNSIRVWASPQAEQALLDGNLNQITLLELPSKKAA